MGGDGWVSVDDLITAAREEETELIARQHVSDVRESHRLECPHCDERWATQESLDRHCLAAHARVRAGQGVPCGIGDCPYAAEDNMRIAVHRWNEHQVRAAEAKARGLPRGPIMREQQDARGPLAKTYPCGKDGCDLMFSSPQALGTHRWREHRERGKAASSARTGFVNDAAPVYLLRWEDPPEQHHGPRASEREATQPIRERIAELRLNVGRWGVIYELPLSRQRSQVVVSSQQSRFRKQAGDGFEFVMRSLETTVALYGRYVGSS